MIDERRRTEETDSSAPLRCAQNDRDVECLDDGLSAKYLRRAIARHYGEENQLRQCQEECAELIAAINHYERALASGDEEKIAKAREAVLGEIADVQIMLDQARDFFGEDTYDMEYLKLQRQWDRIASGEG